MAATRERLQILIDRIYDGAVEDDAWQGVADEIARVFSSTSTVLKVQGAGERVDLIDKTANLAIDPKHQDWSEYWHRHDLWVEKSLAVGMSTIVTSRDLLPDAELKRTAFHGDWLRHLDIFHMMGSVFPIGEGSIGILGIHRPEAGSDFSRADRRQLRTFLPHLLRALQLRQKLARTQMAANTLAMILEHSQDAIVVVDEDRNVVFANVRAEQFFRHNDVIGARQGKLVIHRPESTNRLAHLVKQCVQTARGNATSPGGRIPLSRERRPPLSLSVAPLRGLPGVENMEAKAVVFIHDPDAHGVTSMRLRELFGFTPSEAAVAEALAEGRTLDEIALALGIGLGTVRTHLKKTMLKTGTNKQGQLISLLLRSCP